MSEVQEKTQDETSSPEIEVSSKANEKVALDIEGADFLEDKEEEQEEKQEEEQESLGEGEAAPEEEKKGSKKKLIIIGSAVLLLLICAGAGWWFFLRTPPPPPVEPEIITVPNVPDVAPLPDEYIVSFEPFWVPYTDKELGEVFLVCKFGLVTKSEQLMLEAQNKMVLLRDAVYYYLVNKPHHFLVDPANVSTIKNDLTSVFSGYLVSGKIDDMLFESYLGK